MQGFVRKVCIAISATNANSLEDILYYELQQVVFLVLFLLLLMGFFFVLIFRFIFVFACQDYYIYSFKRRLATGWLFSPGTPVSFTNKTDLHDIAEILLKMALNNIKQNCQAPK